MNHVDDSDQDGCWPWLGSHIGQSKYGQCRCVGEQYAHRVAFILFVGDIPEGFEVLHTCDNPPCVRPSHLFVGTHKDNMADMARKGRSGGHYIRTPEIRAKIAAFRRKHVGWKHSDKTRMKMSASASKRWEREHAKQPY